MMVQAWRSGFSPKCACRVRRTRITLRNPLRGNVNMQILRFAMRTRSTFCAREPASRLRRLERRKCDPEAHHFKARAPTPLSCRDAGARRRREDGPFQHGGARRQRGLERLERGNGRGEGIGAWPDKRAEGGGEERRAAAVLGDAVARRDTGVVWSPSDRRCTVETVEGRRRRARRDIDMVWSASDRRCTVETVEAGRRAQRDTGVVWSPSDRRCTVRTVGGPRRRAQRDTGVVWSPSDRRCTVRTVEGRRRRGAQPTSPPRRGAGP